MPENNNKTINIATHKSFYDKILTISWVGFGLVGAIGNFIGEYNESSIVRIMAIIVYFALFLIIPLYQILGIERFSELATDKKQRASLKTTQIINYFILVATLIFSYIILLDSNSRENLLDNFNGEYSIFKYMIVLIIVVTVLIANIINQISYFDLLKKWTTF